MTESVAWFQRRIDRLEAQVESLVNQVVEAMKLPEDQPKAVSFRGMGHTRTSHDLCDTCGLNGQAFEVSKRNRTPIYCPMPATQSDGRDDA